MGGAVFTSLDGEAHFAALPERVENVVARRDCRAVFRPAQGRPAAAGRRNQCRASGDPRLDDQPRRQSRSRAGAAVRARVLESRDVGHRIVGQYPALQSAENARRYRQPGDRERHRQAAEPDAEVSFVQRDLTAILPRAKIAGAVPMDEVLATVREAANWNAHDTNTRYQVVGPRAAGRALAYAAEGNPDPYAGFEARIVPENITLLPKTTSRPPAAMPRTSGRSSSRRATISRASCASSAPCRKRSAPFARCSAFAAAITA